MMPLAAAAILRTLVGIPTPSAQSNLPLLVWVQEFLSTRGWSVALEDYTDEQGVAKANLIARPTAAEGNRVGLAFVCHSDTVPFRADWHNALQLTTNAEGTHLHGSGACDVKGALACFLAAIGTLPATALRNDCALIVTADEEIGCKGMERMLATTSLALDGAIVSEPTSLRPGVAGKGYGLARVTVHGREAHSAYPQEGANAIDAAARLIVRLEECAATTLDTLFDPPRTTFNVGTITGGTAKNIVAGRTEFLVEWRPIPADPADAAGESLQRLAAEVAAEIGNVTIDVELLRADQGFAPAGEGALQAQLVELLGRERSVTGISFGSEASRLKRIAREVIVIGPGDMHTAHSSRECVPVAELEEWTGVLRALFSTR